MSSESGKIHQAMISILREITAVGKNGKNQQQGYAFRGIDDVYNALNPLMAKYGVFSVPEVLEEKREERQSKAGGVLITTVLRMRYTFFAEDGSHVDVVVTGEGMDSGDKSANKAMAVAHKYALVQIFAIPTVDKKDPEYESPASSPKKPAQASATPASAVPPKRSAKAEQLLEGISKLKNSPELQTWWKMFEKEIHALPCHEQEEIIKQKDQLKKILPLTSRSDADAKKQYEFFERQLKSVMTLHSMSLFEKNVAEALSSGKIKQQQYDLLRKMADDKKERIALVA